VHTIIFGPWGKRTRTRIRELIPNPLLNREELITDPVFIVGNGISRKGFKLERLRGLGTIIGCNALYRDFIPDILTIVNAGMMEEVQEYAKENFCLTHKSLLPDMGSIKVWKAGHVNSSGCLAIRLVALLIKPSKCYMLGMDGCQGNIYHDSKNYPKDLRRNFDRMTTFNTAAARSGEETEFINVNIWDNWPEDAATFMTYTEFEKIL